ncbi:MAG: hypothetical protein PHF86_02840 [Candidatus Nanoarchaeia archaeon]|jgi:hypothetical protein|nr:hypothetical protein [Candidatus Nanoarchaeia archaeon]
MLPQKKIETFPIDTLLEEDDTNIISKYINPHVNCVCCNLPEIAIKINKAYLAGSSYKQIVEEYSGEVLLATGKNLELSTVSEHFTKHFECTGAAIAEFNRKMGFSNLPVVEQNEMKDIFSVLTNRKVNDLELLELSMREQIKRLQELEKIKKDRISEGRTFNLENLIMKQETIMNNMQMNVISKLKMLSKAVLQTKQAEFFDRQLQFLDSKTADYLGLKSDDINPALYHEAECTYLKVVIENIIKRIKSAVDISLSIDQHEKAMFYKEFQKELSGIEDDIDKEFEIRLKDLKEVRVKSNDNV